MASNPYLQSLLLAENSRVHLEEVERLKSRKRATLLLDGYEDSLRRSLYGTIILPEATGMQSFRRKFQAAFPWVLTFAYFLPGLNTIIGNMVAHPAIKKMITASATIVTIFNGSHYWGGQLEEEAKATQLMQICPRPDAQKKTNGFTPVSAAVIEWVMDTEYWNRVDQLIRVFNLADCMLELICCARHMHSTEVAPEDDLGFLDHARTTFMHESYVMNTETHTVILFLHPRCRKLAVSQVAKSRSFQDMCKIALNIAQMWKWDAKRAGALLEDSQLYHACKGVFAGGTTDAKEWWEGLPISGEAHPLKTMAIILFSIVPHAAEVERLFSGLAGIQGVKRCNFTLPTFESLGNMRHHEHMHTRAEPGLETTLANELQACAVCAKPTLRQVCTL
ncbi:hypothetical protein B0H19DRAFT_1209599 [Mycena capillaripes]|nr:hypothetical protein B0H19DRAFT_1209599 [Mycena capillaripes]